MSEERAKTPVELMLDGVEWTATRGAFGMSEEDDGGIPYATHEGVLKIGDASLRCYRLNDGRAIFDQGDFLRFLGVEFLGPTEETR